MLVVADLLDEHLHADVLAVVDPVDLRVLPGLVDQDPGVGNESGRRASDEVIDLVDLLRRPGLQQLAGRPPVDNQRHTVLVLQPDRRGTFLHGLTGVLDLEQSSVRGENCASPVISHLSGLHNARSFILPRHDKASPIKSSRSEGACARIISCASAGP